VFSRVREEVAQGYTEYALLLSGVGLFLLFTLLYLGGQIINTYQWIISHLVL